MKRAITDPAIERADPLPPEVHPHRVRLLTFGADLSYWEFEQTLAGAAVSVESRRRINIECHKEPNHLLLFATFEARNAYSGCLRMSVRDLSMSMPYRLSDDVVHEMVFMVHENGYPSFVSVYRKLETVSERIEIVAYEGYVPLAIVDWTQP